MSENKAAFSGFSWKNIVKKEYFLQKFKVLNTVIDSAFMISQLPIFCLR